MHKTQNTVLAAWLALSSLASLAADAPAATPAPNPNEPVVVPQVDRREVKLPRFPSNDFEVGLFGGAYSVQNFGASIAGGLRLGYHITEDYFVEAALGTTRVKDEAFRRVLPGGIFPTGSERLQYANLSLGVNLLPGEVFLGPGRALPSSIYLIGGVGTTRFAGQRQQSFNLGLGAKVYLRDWLALRVDMRDHIYSLDLLGKRESTQNLELSTGLSYLF
ncbi:MAG: outer membrane beta-barrel domain-containing protein [Vitreoscilla sp.]|nr:outer membrane beta-barrel domain-containing protein [Burkholderiales bacterium]MBP6337422.1 outer membrane beta-barrel domain-containing protein [Vitreoscilla sp.]MBP6675436.1 outer membrane beta-barrel domain-containing protein [Vitreoscilla sp.]